MRPWVSRIAQNEVIDHCRGQSTHLRWLKPGVDVQELPPDPATAAGQTNAVIAAEFGMSEAAFDQRIARFKAKWIPRWKKHKREQALFVVLVLLFLGGLLWWFFHGPKREEARPTAVPVLSAAPTPSAAPEEQFDNAEPTQPPPDDQEKKPQQRLKP